MGELNNLENLYSLEEPDYIEIGDENNFEDNEYVEIDVNTAEYEYIEENVNYSEEPEYINTFNDGNSSNVNNSPQIRAGINSGVCACNGYQTPSSGCVAHSCSCQIQATACTCDTQGSVTPVGTYVSIIFSVKINSIKSNNKNGIIIPSDDWCSAITLTFISGNTSYAVFSKNQDYNFTHISNGYYIYSAHTEGDNYISPYSNGNFNGKFTLKTINGHITGGTINLSGFSDSIYSISTSVSYPSMPSYSGYYATISATPLTYKFKFGASGDTATTSNASSVLNKFRIGTRYNVSANGVSGQTYYGSNYIWNVAYAQISGTTIKVRPLCFYIQTSAKTFTVGMTRPGSESKNATYSDATKLNKISSPPASDYRLATFKSLYSNLSISSLSEKLYINDENMVLTPKQWGNLSVKNSGYTAPTMFALSPPSTDCCYHLDDVYLFDEYMYLDNKTGNTGTSYNGYTVDEVLNKYDSTDGFAPTRKTLYFTFYI